MLASAAKDRNIPFSLAAATLSVVFSWIAIGAVLLLAFLNSPRPETWREATGLLAVVLIYPSPEVFFAGLLAAAWLAQKSHPSLFQLLLRDAQTGAIAGGLVLTFSFQSGQPHPDWKSDLGLFAAGAVLGTALPWR